MKCRKKANILLAAFIILSFVCMAIANGIQTDGGKVAIEDGSIETDLGTLTYKLYKPETASEQQPAPGLLLLHGYQNDHETSGAYAIEMARRGAVVLALDEYGHGSTTVGMKERGYTDHKVTVTYGNDSEADGTYVQISGPTRYRVMMNFSNLTFFNDHYSKGSDGSSVKDSSMGGIAAYAVLSELPYVDASRLAVSGHSMGTWASWTVSAAYSGAVDAEGRDISPKATILQCGELFRKSVYDSENIKFNNVLLLQSKYDEFSYFRDYANTVTDELLDQPVRTEFLGVSAEESEWNTTYGDFADGSARRIELLNTNHRLTTHNTHGMMTAIEWLTNAIGMDTSIASADQVFLGKEWLVFLAMMLAIAAMIPFMELLLTTAFFAPVAQGVPDRPEKAKSGWKWWKGAIITILIAGASYPFMTQLGHGLLPLPENIFRMTIGNGFVAWYSLLILIMLATTIIPFVRSKKKGSRLDWVDLGLAREEHRNGLDWSLCGRSALLALCMLALMYVMLLLCEAAFDLDYRFIWPFFKSFTGERVLQFLVYLPIFALFFLLNNSKIFAQMRTPAANKPGFGGFMSCWWRNALCMAGGIVLIILIEYIPFFAGIGPGADLLFGSTFGGPFMSLMIVFVPQVLVFSVLCTLTYRKTGSIYTGAFTIAAMAAWIVTGGSAMI